MPFLQHVSLIFPLFVLVQVGMMETAGATLFDVIDFNETTFLDEDEPRV